MIMVSIAYTGVTHMELTPTIASLYHPTQILLRTIGELSTQKVIDDWAEERVLHNANVPTECAIHCSLSISFMVPI